MELAGDPTFADLVALFDEVVSEAYERQLPIAILSKLIRSNPERGTGPLFDIRINTIPFLSGRKFTRAGARWPIEIERKESEFEKQGYDIDDWWDGISLIDFQDRIYSDGTIDRYALFNANAVSAQRVDRLSEDLGNIVVEASTNATLRVSGMTHRHS